MGRRTYAHPRPSSTRSTALKPRLLRHSWVFTGRPQLAVPAAGPLDSTERTRSAKYVFVAAAH